MGGVHGAAAGGGLETGLPELGKHIPAEGGLLVWRWRAEAGGQDTSVKAARGEDDAVQVAAAANNE
jgi:hypothetical protein